MRREATLPDSMSAVSSCALTHFSRHLAWPPPHFSISVGCPPLPPVSVLGLEGQSRRNTTVLGASVQTFAFCAGTSEPWASGSKQPLLRGQRHHTRSRVCKPRLHIEIGGRGQGAVRLMLSLGRGGRCLYLDDADCDLNAFVSSTGVWSAGLRVEND